MGNRRSGTPQEPPALALPDSRFPIPDSRLHLYYGGTFDPVHRGHLAIACAARDELHAPVHFVPAADPPHRAPPGADAAQRARMLELAVGGERGLLLDLRELRRAGLAERPSYTVDTLQELRRELGPRAPIAWLLGADSLVSLHTWHRWQVLLELAHLVVAERPGTPVDSGLAPALQRHFAARWSDSVAALAAPAGRIHRLRQPLREESASEVRRRIGAGGAWRPLVPDAVADFIVEQRLYGAGAS